MPHVTWYYEMFLPSGHHRQPRNASVQLDLAAAGGGDFQVNGSCSPTYFSQLPYTLGGGNGMAKMMFWSVTDGTSGQVLPPGTLNQTVGTLPLTITAWYYPISGPGVGDGSAIIDDAFSANLGKFIDDTFVDVTSDPSLTSNANVVGVVPTTKAETLVAKISVMSTTEPFHVWVLNGSFMVSGQPALNVPQGTDGIAVAIYQDSGKPHFNIGWYASYDPWWWIKSWWGHGPDDPEGPINFAVATELAFAASRAAPHLRAQIIDAALQQAKLGAALIEKQGKTTQAK